MNEVFEGREAVVSVHLGQGGLTYETGDMGREADRVPAPLAFRPKLGLYLVDPGPGNAPEPSLQRFSVDGKRVFRVQLHQALALKSADGFEPKRLLVDATGTVSLVYALNDGREAMHVARFGVDGRPQGEARAPWLEATDAWLPEASGTMWTIRNRSDATELRSFGAGGVVEAAVALPSGTVAAAVAGGRVLVVNPKGEARVLEPGGTAHIPAATALPSALEGIGGTGRFAGIVALKEGPTGPDAHGRSENVAWLQVLSVAPLRGQESLVVVGAMPFALSVSNYDMERDTDRSYEMMDPRWMVFDDAGSLYLVARTGPSNPALTVYRLALRKEIRERLEEKASP